MASGKRAWVVAGVGAAVASGMLGGGGVGRGQGLPFLSGDTLSVLRLGTGQGNLTSAATAVFIDEYVVAADGTASLRQSIPLPSAGALALTMPGTVGGRDGVLTRSVDGRFLLLAGYRRDAGLSNPLILPSWDSDNNPATPFAHRVVGLLAADGTADTRTTLRETGDNTAFRAVASDNGSRLWLALDNNGGVTLTGGTRYVTRQTSVEAVNTVNLSQRQSLGGFPTPDNIRSVQIFGGQLYNSSGSNSSVGSDAFRVGVGLPTSGSQTLTPITDGSRSISSLYLLDIDDDPSTGDPRGFDVMYAVGSSRVLKLVYDRTPLPGQPDGHFRSADPLLGERDEIAEGVGYMGYATGVAARKLPGGAAEVLFSTSTGIYRYVDPAPLTRDVPDDLGAPIVAADGIRTAFRGISFSPYTDPFIPADVQWAGVGTTWSANPLELHFTHLATGVLVPFGQGTGASAGTGDRVRFGTPDAPLAGGTVTVGQGGVTPSAMSVAVATGQTLHFAGGAVSVAGALVKHGGGTVMIDRLLAAGELDVRDGVLRLATHATPVVLWGLKVGQWAFVDISGNDLVLRGGELADVRALVRRFLTAQAGLPGESGLGSSLAFYPGDGAFTTLAVYDNAVAGHTLSSFGGVAVGPNDVLVKYTYVGDLDLDGSVTAADLARLLQGLNGTASAGGWNFGDVNYDGVVDVADLGRVLAALRGQGAPLVNGGGAVGSGGGGGGGVVPEPGAAAVLMALVVPLLRRRRPAFASGSA